MAPWSMPTVRQITRAAAAEDYRISAFIVGVARSPAFRMSRPPAVTDEQDITSGG